MQSQLVMYILQTCSGMYLSPAGLLLTTFSSNPDRVNAIVSREIWGKWKRRKRKAESGNGKSVMVVAKPLWLTQVIGPVAVYGGGSTAER